jgi:hypothetical protein
MRSPTTAESMLLPSGSRRYQYLYRERFLPAVDSYDDTNLPDQWPPNEATRTGTGSLYNVAAVGVLDLLLYPLVLSLVVDFLAGVLDLLYPFDAAMFDQTSKKSRDSPFTYLQHTNSPYLDHCCCCCCGDGRERPRNAQPGGTVIDHYGEKQLRSNCASVPARRTPTAEGLAGSSPLNATSTPLQSVSDEDIPSSSPPALVFFESSDTATEKDLPLPTVASDRSGRIDITGNVIRGGKSARMRRVRPDSV